MDEEKLEHFGIGRKLWISKEEAQKMWPEIKKGKWEYQCNVCGIKVKGEGEVVRQCNCMNPWSGKNG